MPRKACKYCGDLSPQKVSFFKYYIKFYICQAMVTYEEKIVFQLTDNKYKNCSVDFLDINFGQ